MGDGKLVCTSQARRFQHIVGGILAMHGPQRVGGDGEKVGGGRSGGGDKGEWN